MRTLHLDALAIFRAVARQGGVVRAAEHLHRVPSNISTRLQQLEQRLGVALFRRQGRTRVLTAEGQSLLVHAERLLHLADEAEAQVRGGAGSGRLRLGAMESTAGARLPTLLADLHRHWPDLALELRTGTTDALLRQVAGYELDAAFVGEPFEAGALNARPVFDETLVLVTPLSQAPVRTPADLGEATLLAFAAGCAYRARLEHWFAAHDARPARLLELASYQAIIACAAAGTGCGIVPVSLLDGLAAAASVARHRLPAEVARNRTHLVWAGEPSPALSGLLERLPALKTGPRAR